MGRLAGLRGGRFLLAGGVAYLALFAAVAIARYEPLRPDAIGYLPGDAPYYLSAAHSLLHDRDLELRNQLRGDARLHELCFSLGARGEWYPKHPVLMPLLAAPLVALAGPPGALAFNVAALALAALAAQGVAAVFVRPAAALLGTAVLVAGSYVPHFAYNFSGDVLAALVATAALLAWLRGAHLVGGLLAGLALWAKLTHVVFVAAAGLGVVLLREPRPLARWLAGLALGLAPFLLLNAAQFGAPWRTGYDRIAVVRPDGSLGVHSHRGDFDRPLAEGLGEQLLAPGDGLLRTSPILLAAPAGALVWLRRRPREAALLLGASLALLLLVSRYRYAGQGAPFASRLLLAAVLLGATPLACLAEAALARRAPAPGRSRDASAA